MTSASRKETHFRSKTSLVLLAALAAAGCAKGQSDADAAAVASAREAQVRAEAELKAVKELAARQPVAPEPQAAAEPGVVAPTPVSHPAAVAPTPVAPGVAPAAPAAPTPAADPTASACGCKTPACSCVTVTVSITPSARKPGNVDWDPMGGAPDPQLTLRTPLLSKKSQVFKDQLSAAATFPQIPLAPGDTVAIDAFDSDAMTSDPMGTFSTTYSGGNATKSGSMAAASVTVQFTK